MKNNNNQRPKTVSKVVWDTYRDFAENSSIHALKYTVNSEIGYYEKIFWNFVIFCGLCGAIYMTVLFCQRYSTDPTRSSIYTMYAPSTSIPFPAVSICNINFIMSSKVEKFMNKIEYNHTDELIIRKALPELLYSFMGSKSEINITELEIILNVLEQNDYNNMTSLIDELSQDCSEMLIDCIWNRRKISCLENFRKTIIYSGTCCDFNFRSGLERLELFSQYNGIDTGLRVLLDLQMQEVSRLNTAGFKVAIRYPYEFVGRHTSSRLVVTGKTMYLQISSRRRFFSESLKSFSVDKRRCCYPNEYKLKYFDGHYSDTKCFFECEEYWYLNLCGCVPFYFTFSDEVKCNLSSLPCLDYLKTNDILNQKMDKCDCPSLCENIQYQLISTSARIESVGDSYMKPLGNITELNKYNLLSVFFQDNRQLIHQRYTLTSAINLLSCFGGIYGLFLGCSLVTIAEIIYYILFRFPLNLKFFNRIRTNTKDTYTRKIPGKSVKFNNRYDSDGVYYVYGNTTLLH